MKQVVLLKPGQFSTVETSPPTLMPGHALTRIHRVGICGTDYHAFAGRQPFFKYPRILGHELAVTLDFVAENKFGLKAGDKCAVEPYLSCGRCRVCVKGRYNCCEQLQCLGVHTDGGMRGFLSLPFARLHRSEKLSLDQLALVETLGIGAHAVERSGLQAGETVLVVGAGPIGLAVIQFAQAARGRVRVLELNETRRTFVESLGVEVLSEPDKELADVVFDATGNAKAMEASFNLVAHGGRLVLVGLVQNRVAFDDPSLHKKEITVLASRNSANAFPRIIRMIEQGQIDTSPWITHRLTLSEVPDQFAELSKNPGLVKAMITIEESDL